MQIPYGPCQCPQRLLLISGTKKKRTISISNTFVLWLPHRQPFATAIPDHEPVAKQTPIDVQSDSFHKLYRGFIRSVVSLLTNIDNIAIESIPEGISSLIAKFYKSAVCPMHWFVDWLYVYSMCCWWMNMIHIESARGSPLLSAQPHIFAFNVQCHFEGVHCSRWRRCSYFVSPSVYHRNGLQIGSALLED